LCKLGEAVMKQKIGLLLIAIGFLLVLASMLHDAVQGSTSYGGVILIGPIPIVIGSNPQMTLISMLMAAALMIISYILFWRHK
jgi:uncharacterized protein (TIGR00304 family)